MKKIAIMAMLTLLITSVFAAAVSAGDFDDTRDFADIQAELFQEIPVDTGSQGSFENFEIKINGDEIDLNDCFEQDFSSLCEPGIEVLGDIERGTNLDIQVKFRPQEDLENLQVQASIDGDNNDDLIFDRIETEDYNAGRTYRRDLHLELPESMDMDVYALRVELTNRAHEKFTVNIPLEITSPKNSVVFQDVLFRPASLTVEAGRILTANVRVENFGMEDEEDVKVTVEVPTLNLRDYSVVEEVDSDKKKTAAELYLDVPKCAAPGEYELLLTADFDDRDKTVQEAYTLTVVDGGRCTSSVSKIELKAPEAQNVVAGGAEATFPISVENKGTESKTIQLELSAGDWAAVRLDNPVLVVEPGQTGFAYAFVAANSDAPLGEKVVRVKATSGSTDAELSLNANVVSGDAGWDNVKKGLEIGLVVLVVLLVILGLIVGFSRLKGRDDEEDDDKKTYY